jgi:hypothetical protein
LTPDLALPGPALQTATWVNPNKDAIWSTSWVSAGDAKFQAATPYDGDFYITASRHLTTDIKQALMSQPPLNGLSWNLTLTIYEPLAAGQIMVVTFVRCEPDGSFCAPVGGWQSTADSGRQSDSWPHCTQAMKLSGGCFELQGSEGVAARLKYTPKIRIATQGQPFRLSSLSVALSMRAMNM